MYSYVFAAEVIIAFTVNVTKLLSMKSFYFLVVKHLLTKHGLRNTTLGHVLWPVSFRNRSIHVQEKIKREVKEKGGEGRRAEERKMPPAKVKSN